MAFRELTLQRWISEGEILRYAQNDTLRLPVVILRSEAAKNLSVIANTETAPLSRAQLTVCQRVTPVNTRPSSVLVLSAIVFILVAGCGATDSRALSRELPLSPTVKVEFRFGEAKAQPGLSEATVVATGKKVYLHERVELSNQDVEGVSLLADPLEICIRLSRRVRLFEFTRANIGRYLVVIVNGQVVCAPVVTCALPGDTVCVSGTTSEHTKEIFSAMTGKKAIDRNAERGP